MKVYKETLRDLAKASIGITLDALSSELGFGRSYLSVKFSRHDGEPIDIQPAIGYGIMHILNVTQEQLEEIPEKYAKSGRYPWGSEKEEVPPVAGVSTEMTAAIEKIAFLTKKINDNTNANQDEILNAIKKLNESVLSLQRTIHADISNLIGIWMPNKLETSTGKILKADVGGLWGTAKEVYEPKEGDSKKQ